MQDSPAVEPTPSTPSKTGRKNNPEKTRQAILAAAVAEFADLGLTGARVDAIAERTHTSKRMIYYYFGSKEGLYLAVLEKLYSNVRATEAQLPLDSLPPLEAIRRLTEFTFEHHRSHDDFIRLVSIENIHRGHHLARSETISSLNLSALQSIRRILERGEANGEVRPGLDAVDVHLLISAFCFFRVSNRHTFGLIHRVDLDDEDSVRRHKAMIGDAVVGYLKP
ncbi:TetR family transcriptional regulator [Pseudomonas oryzihabitans]|uniref:TetR family transcriptional regulator n=1 Tax=Pseudomonas oryzihabitans TaxID=47885 RepID=UPI0028950EA4|nr:TetR family transcriptional regulator [Pseudomonas oryzihabitans]MDT3722108.1 TetR family transcriptional regulator [Pseudomonas oryzihabitans]